MPGDSIPGRWSRVLRTQPRYPQAPSLQHFRLVSGQETGILRTHRTAAGRVGAPERQCVLSKEFQINSFPVAESYRRNVRVVCRVKDLPSVSSPRLPGQQPFTWARDPILAPRLPQSSCGTPDKLLALQSSFPLSMQWR